MFRDSTEVPTFLIEWFGIAVSTKKVKFFSESVRDLLNEGCDRRSAVQHASERG